MAFGHVIAIGPRCLIANTDLEYVIAIGADVELPDGTRNYAKIPGVYEGPLIDQPELDALWPTGSRGLPRLQGRTPEEITERVMIWSEHMVRVLPPEVDAQAVFAAVYAALEANGIAPARN
jgi:hypothetical protein